MTIVEDETNEIVTINKFLDKHFFDPFSNKMQNDR